MLKIYINTNNISYIDQIDDELYQYGTAPSVVYESNKV